MKIWEWLQGKKTYLIAAAGVIWGLYTGNYDIVWQALALVGIRSALQKLE